MAASIQVLGIQSHRSAELHLLIHGGGEASAHLSVGANLSAHLGIVSHVRDQTNHHIRHSTEVSDLAHSRELGLSVQLVVHGKISALEEVVANARAKEILIGIGHAKVDDGLAVAGSSDLHSHQHAVVLGIMWRIIQHTAQTMPAL